MLLISDLWFSQNTSIIISPLIQVLIFIPTNTNMNHNKIKNKKEKTPKIKQSGNVWLWRVYFRLMVLQTDFVSLINRFDFFLVRYINVELNSTFIDKWWRSCTIIYFTLIRFKMPTIVNFTESIYIYILENRISPCFYGCSEKKLFLFGSLVSDIYSIFIFTLI